MKDASVYVDGGYAGTVGQLKTFQLKPGSHDVELRNHNGNSFYQEHIEVVAGKTLKLVRKFRKTWNTGAGPDLASPPLPSHEARSVTKKTARQARLLAISHEHRTDIQRIHRAGRSVQ